MAVNISRSMNEDLEEGMTDGSLVKTARDRGGELDPRTGAALSTLHPEWYSTGVDDHVALRRYLGIGKL